MRQHNLKAIFAYFSHCLLNIHYTQVQNVFTLSTVINRAEHAQSILIIAHKYMRIVIVIISY